MRQLPRFTSVNFKAIQIKMCARHDQSIFSRLFSSILAFSCPLPVSLSKTASHMSTPIHDQRALWAMRQILSFVTIWPWGGASSSAFWTRVSTKDKKIVQPVEKNIVLSWTNYVLAYDGEIEYSACILLSIWISWQKKTKGKSVAATLFTRILNILSSPQRKNTNNTLSRAPRPEIMGKNEWITWDREERKER